MGERRLVEVVSGVLVATSRRYATTTTVAAPDGPGGPALLVDPAWEPDELAALGAEVGARGLRIAAGVSTHAHHDHVLWHPDLPDVPRYASPVTAALAGRHRADLVDGLGPGWPPELAELVGRVTPAEDGSLPWAGREVELVVHDAHVPGHTAVWVPGLSLLVAGDMLSDIELPLPGDDADGPDLVGTDPLGAYAAGLERLAPYVAAAVLVVPGHGSPTSEGQARLDADRRYLDELVAGRSCTDARLRRPAMQAAHAANLAWAGR